MTENLQPIPKIELTDAERQKIKETAEKIDLTDSSLCLTYGTAGQKKLVSLSDKLFRLSAAGHSEEIGERMRDLIRELRDFSAVQGRRGLFAWMFRSRDRKNLHKRYESAAENTDAIAEELEKHRNQLLRDHVMLEKLYESVLEQYRELTVLTEGGQRKLDEDTSAERETRERFEKRLHDLKLSRMVCMQTLTQIRVLQGCNAALSEKIQSLLTNTIALWKNQTALALAVKNTGRAMEGVRGANGEMIGGLEEVCKAENEILRESDAMEKLAKSVEK